MYFVTLSLILALASCNNPEDSENESATENAVYTPPAVPKIAIGAEYFIGNWINQYYIEATTKKDTLRSFVSYTFTPESTYSTDSGINDKWGFNATANTFYLYYKEGTTYAEYDVEVINAEEFNFKRIYDNNLFIYNFKKLK